MQSEKRQKRKLERVLRRTKSADDGKLCEEHSDHYCHLLITTRQEFYNGKIQSCAGDQKAVFNVPNKLLHRNFETQLPVHDSSIELANRLANFFMEKINGIRDGPGGTCPSTLVSDDVNICSSELDHFTSVDQDVRQLIQSAKTKSCSLDPIRTCILKQHLPSFSSVTTKIINMSLNDAIMPSSFKEAILTPILKKSSSNPEVLKHFRPVSNVAFISMLIEKVVVYQIFKHIQINGLYEKMQSANKQHHSTETAWVRLHNGILQAMDDNKGLLLVSLDLNSAFDTTDHDSLLYRLEHRLGITGNYLSWFKLYLSERKFRVKLMKSFLSPKI